MQDYKRKFDAAIDELGNAGIWKTNAVPLYTKLFRKIGMTPKPPHYVGFWQVALGMGIWFASVWGILMYVLFWKSAGLPIIFAILSAIFAGASFGLLMAYYYRNGRKKHSLTPWGNL